MRINDCVKVALLSILVIFVLSTKAFALSEIITDANAWREKGKTSTSSSTGLDMKPIKKASDKIYNSFLGIGIIAAVGVGGFLGIQFMTAGVDKKVEVKQALVAYAVGCVVIFGAFGIWKLVLLLIGEVF